MEVDPDKAAAGTDIQGNLRQLTSIAQMFMEKIMVSLNSIPMCAAPFFFPMCHSRSSFF